MDIYERMIIYLKNKLDKLTQKKIRTNIEKNTTEQYKEFYNTMLTYFTKQQGGK